MANSALGQTGFGADAIATSNVQNSAITAAKIADDTITEAKLAAGATLQLGTKQATTSGTSIDFTGIPAGTKEIRLMFNGVSVSGTSDMRLQLGGTGGVETSGYLGVGGYVSSGGAWGSLGAGFDFTVTGASRLVYGAAYFTLMDAATNTWAVSCHFAIPADNFLSLCNGVKALSAELDRIRITTVNGTDTFDAGSINIAYK